MPSSTPRNPHSIDIKRMLRVAIAQSGQAKVVAIDCGVCPSAMSHWTSDSSETCLPVDLLPAFLASTGNLSILHYLAEQTGHQLVPINEKAPDGTRA